MFGKSVSNQNSIRSSLHNRDIANDLIRIIAMFLVIGVHWFGSLAEYCPREGMTPVIFDFINELTRLGVPLFFSLSGYYILGREITDIKAFYYKRFVRVVVPYLLYAVLYVFYFTVFEAHEPTMLLKNYVLNVLTDNVHGTHWFVYSIVGLYFATPFLSRMFENLSDSEVTTLYITAVILGVLKDVFGVFRYEFGINTYVFEGVLLTFMSGYCTKRCFRFFGADKWKYTTVYTWVAAAILLVLFYATEMGCLLGLIAGLALNGNKEMEVSGVFRNVITCVSRYSYSVYLVHAAVISAVLHVYTGWSEPYFGLKVAAGYVIVFVFSFGFALIFDSICTNRLTVKLEKNNYKNNS